MARPQALNNLSLVLSSQEEEDVPLTLVRLIGNYRFDVAQATPGGNETWGAIRYTTDPVSEADYVVSFNYSTDPTEVICPAEHCWTLVQEPPTKLHHYLHTSHRSFSRIYSSDESLQGHHRKLSAPYLGWYSKRDYDTLKHADPPEKTADLSTVTSNLRWLAGHKTRSDFLQKLQQKIEFEWFGRGVKELDDKWDGLAPFRYSLAFENSRYNYYWTEKVADCFLSWTMPIYYGCPRIAEYFPKESMVLIDIEKPEEAIEIIRETVSSQRFEENLEAIRQARELVLERYNTLAFLTRQIEEHQKEGCQCKPKPQLIRPRKAPITILDYKAYAVKHRLERLFKRPVRSPWTAS